MTPSSSRRELIAGLVRDVRDFPQPGVLFKDITPLLASPVGLRATVDELVDAAPAGVDVVVGMEARGFIFAAPVAVALGAGFVPVRKPGKLPFAALSEEFSLEYGTATLSVHSDAIAAGSRVLVIDDVLATGGTIAATAQLVKRLGAELVQVSVVLELNALKGREQLAARGIEACTALLRV